MMMIRRCCLFAALLWSTHATAADFGSPGGPEPANIEDVARQLRQDPYDMELLISFGTSKGGSAGHLALAIRAAVPGDDLVHSANFYADREPEHAESFYTNDLMLRIPKREYLFGTASSLGETASFGLDFGEVYKRSVVGLRVFGVPPAEQAAGAAYFARMNDDFQQRARDTEYHSGEVKYDYMRLNCAKTIGAAFHHGARYEDVEVTSARVLKRRRVAVAANANIPTEMAMKLMRAWHARGYGMDVVLYKKYSGSTWVDPHDEEKIAFKDLPDRFPSVLSRDFLREEGTFKDYDNLFAMYLLYNLGKYRVRINDETKALEIERSKGAMSYAEAAELARESARSDSDIFRQRLPSRPTGRPVGETWDDG